MTDGDDQLDRVRDELGDPLAAYGLGPARFWAKLAGGVALLVAGVVLVVLLWVFEVIGAVGLLGKLIIAPVLLGAGLLWNLFKTRGLTVLLYPTGLLRAQRGVVRSFPWAEIETVRLKAEQAGVEDVRGPDGRVADLWLTVDPPLVRLWNAGLTLTRTDGTTAVLTPAVAGYTDLVERVLRATFPDLAAKALARFRAGDAVTFGPYEVTGGGLRSGKNLLPWADLTEIGVQKKNVVVKRKGKWTSWAAHDLEHIPNPHVFLALVDEARRTFAPPAAPPPVRREANGPDSIPTTEDLR